MGIATQSGSLRADFFVLRAPLLAVETLSCWAEQTSALTACGVDDERLGQALAADRALLRERLAEIAADRQFEESLALTSPDLADGVDRWRVDPHAKRHHSAEMSLVRYLTRVASRPDLFGLAGAYVIGQFSGDPRLELGPRTQLEVRAALDSGLLRDAVRLAATQAAGNDDLRVRRNPAVYRVGGRLRVAAHRPGTPNYRLVEIRPTAAIELALETARDGVPIASILTALDAAGSEPDHAHQVIQRLMASELLVPVAEISVTGADATTQSVEKLAGIPGAESYAKPIEDAAGYLASAPSVGREVIDLVAGVLSASGLDVKRRNCIHVDAKRPGDVQLPRRLAREMSRCVDLLAMISPSDSEALSSFAEAFERRFGTRSVPLLEALDPDFGIRLGADGPAPTAERSRATGLTRQRTLLSLVERGRSTPGATVELSERDIARLSGERPAPLPDAFAMLTSVVGRDAAAVGAGEFQLVAPTIVGPSGARLLGRLCRGDTELEAHVRAHLRREAALRPEVIFAEISLAAETDAGLSVTQRPLLRDWEIEYGGASGAPAARRLAPGDLLVSVEDGDVVLRSAGDGRPVLPSCTTAINLQWVSLPAARFLLSIAHQGTAGFLGWSWDDLSDAPALPRVIHGRTILAPRRWNITSEEFADVGAGTDAAGFRRLHEWRLNRDLPRLVGFDHPKGCLVVDFGNVLSVEAFLAGRRGLDILRFVEVPALEQSPVRGPDGHYVHELIVPFTLDRTRRRPAPRRRAPRPVRESRRRFQPGTEWLYGKLYGPVSGADRVLVDHVGPLARHLRQAGLVDRWFFIRYRDPGRHLRVRFHGHPGELMSQVLPALHDATADAVDSGLLHRISLDTYEREIERYGGCEGVDLMEAAAEADSDAVIEILRHPLNSVERRHLTVASLARLYADAGLSPEEAHACCVSLRTTWAPRDRPLGALLGTTERSERGQLSEIIAALEREEAESPIASLRKRSSSLVPVLRQLRSLDQEGVLQVSFQEVMCSLAHMGVNRLLKRGGNADELRVHDALARLYEGQMARDRVASRAQAELTA